LEQPEIHLHPSVQAALADVFIDVVTERNIQIIVESHSEHLLRRLQRRIAEQQIAADRAALYFTSTQNGTSKIDKLQIDIFGNISNWPEGFFGDELGELAAMTEATIRRQQEAAKA
jgi:predicted ATPase